MPDQLATAASAERHPSAEERDWTERVLEPALAKAPERPIGARTGVNVDAEGNARFTTISGLPIERLYTEADLPPDSHCPCPASLLIRGASIPPDTAANSGPCGSSPASPRRKKPTRATLPAGEWRRRTLGRVRPAHVDGV